MIQLVIFDIAGTTIIDKEAVHHAFIEALSQFGYEVSDEEVTKVKNIAKPLAIQMILAWQGVPNSIISGNYIYRIYNAFVRIVKEYYHTSPYVIASPNAERVFKLLHNKGIKIALGSSFSKELTDILLNRFQWREKGLVDVVISSDEVEEGQPEPLMIQKAMQLLNIKDVASVAKVGDTLLDLQEGTNAGCKYVIGITSGAYNKEDLEKQAHTHLISDLSELAGIFFPISMEMA